MSSVRAATTAALWGAAHAAGAGADAVLAAIDSAGFRAGVRAGDAPTAEQTGLPGPGCAALGSAALLPLLRSGGPTELLLPVPGDLRGLGADGAALVPALDAGAAVVLGGSGVALVPLHGGWRAYRVPGGAPVPTPRDAALALDEAVAAATTSLVRLEVARGGDSARDRVAAVMREEAVPNPPGMPRLAAELLARAIALQALLAVAADQPSGAVSKFELAAVDDSLRPLAGVLRECRRAAVAHAVAAMGSVDSRG